MGDALAVEDQRSILSTHSVVPQPSELVKRIRALANKLLPVQVELSAITDATSSIITPEVISTFAKCGGDFGEAVPFCLLRARATFMKDAYYNPADYDENMCRAIACEVLARRIVHNLPAGRLESVMSTRFRYRESDGDASAPVSALETAIDQHCTTFLSSSEAQYVVQALWKGDLVQMNNDDEDIDYVPYEKSESGSFWDHMNPQRISVPRYQAFFRIVVWLFYLFVYSQAVSSPLDAIDPERQFDEWEYVLYIMTLAFLLEEAIKVYKTIQLANRPLATVGFWTIVNFLIDGLLLSAFSLRVAGLRVDMGANPDKAEHLQLRSFQVLSCVAPLIWIKVALNMKLTVFDGFQVVGTLQVVVFRMLRESAVFFILLAIMALGFAQSMYALDAADGESGGGVVVANSLIQALLGSPDFDSPNGRFGYPFGLIVYYSWNFLSALILTNVLIALFGSAYSDVVDNATDEYLAFFAHKTIDLIRAPDSYVYPAPFNLIEAVLIAPFEWFLPSAYYVGLNRFVMSVLFFVPLSVIALFESQVAHPRSRRIQLYLESSDIETEDDPKTEDPTCDDDAEGEISKVKFEDLVKAFPNTAITESAVVSHEMKALRNKVEQLERILRESTPFPEDGEKEKQHKA